MSRAEEIERRLPGWLAAALPAYLPSRRWFADKGRDIEAVRLQDLAWLAPPEIPALGPERLLEAPALALALIRVELSGGAGASYQLPLAWRPAGGCARPPAEAIAGILEAGAGWISEGIGAPGFGAACLEALSSARRFGGQHGTFAFLPSPPWTARGDRLSQLASGSARLSRSEQSNSTLFFADAGGAARLLFKCFRRLEPGRNPDAEMTGYLAAHGAERLVPPLAGTLEYRPYPAGESISVSAGAGRQSGAPVPWTLGIFQEFVPNEGDGWEFTLRLLAAAAAAPHSVREARAAELIPPLRQLAEATAAMHLTLATAPKSEPDLAPAPISAADWDRWSEGIAAAARRLRDEVARTPEAAALGDRLTGVLRPGFPEGLSKIRVHGDFHLGQTLRASDGGWRILDFEGEPARPLAERRQKFCALKDVAGMLRSLEYAAGAAARAASAPLDPLPGWLEAWRKKARQAFEDAYFARLDAAAVCLDSGGAPPIVPRAPAGRSALLRFFEVEKAIYEAGYELRNRPAWLPLPLAGLHRLLR